MSGFIKGGLSAAAGIFTGGTSVWLPYAIVAGLAIAGTGALAYWVVEPRIEAAELKVAVAQKQVTDLTAANAETERSLRLQKLQADYDRKATEKKLTEVAATADHAAAIKKDLSHAQGAQEPIDPIDLYTNQRLRELRAARRDQDGDSVSPATGKPPALPGRPGTTGG